MNRITSIFQSIRAWKSTRSVSSWVNSRQNKLLARALANTMGVSPWKSILRRPPLTSLIIVLTGYFIIFNFLALLRHQHFFSQGWDLGMYDQIVWQYSQGMLAYSTYTFLIDFADRFRPVLLLIAPIYSLFPHTQTLIVLQNLAITLAAVPIYFAAVKKTHHHFFALSLTLAFLFFIGIQSLLMDDFHTEAFLVPFLAAAVYFLYIQNWRLYWLFFFLTLTTREHSGFLLAAVAVYALFIKTSKKVAIVSFFIGVAWSTLAIAWLMPSLGQNQYQGFLGGDLTFSQELVYLMAHPQLTFHQLLTPVVKTQTIAISFFPFAFLPLLHPPILIPVVYQFASRFLDQLHPYRWTPYFHFSADLAVLLAFGTIYSSANLVKKISWPPSKTLTILGLLLLAATALEQLLLPVPIKLIFKPDYFILKPYVATNLALINQIPKNASVATQNNLAAHLSQRHEIYILPRINAAAYILLDLHPGQSDFNFYGQSYPQMYQLINHLSTQNQYQLIARHQDTFLFKRI